MSRLRSIAALVALVVCAAPAAALTVLPLDLQTLTTEAGRIFVGRVERVDTGHDASGLAATWTTFAVEEDLKGGGEAHVTLKQLATSLGGDDAHVLPHPALPRYRPGESVLLFVHPESTLGFTSPVGLGQGCFRLRTEHGTPVAENDVGNRNLGSTTTGAARAHTSAAAGLPAPTETMPLADLLAGVRALVAADH